jgi:hypothetical protein
LSVETNQVDEPEDIEPDRPGLFSRRFVSWGWTIVCARVAFPFFAAASQYYPASGLLALCRLVSGLLGLPGAVIWAIAAVALSVIRPNESGHRTTNETILISLVALDLVLRFIGIS